MTPLSPAPCQAVASDDCQTLPVEARRRLIIISAFLCGGIAGAAAFRSLGYATWFIPSELIALTALTRCLYRFRQSAEPDAPMG